MQTQRSRQCEQNEEIFREGEAGDCAYLVERGRVLIYLTKDDTEVTLKTLGEGEVFGEMSLIDNHPRSASCRALCETKLLMVTREQLLDRIATSDPVVRLLMRALLERLRGQNNAARGSVLGFSPADESFEQEKKEVLKRIELENRLYNALRNDEFVPFYQPIYDLRSLELRGSEALIRWFSPDGNVIPPSLFMDVIEQSSLMQSVGEVIIEKCLKDLSRMQRMTNELDDFFVSINIGGRQFADPQFLDHLEATRHRYGLNPSHIKLEITERVMMEGLQATAVLQKCRDLGYLLAVDDFGTGFSSLQYLTSMPLTDLKIDRSFVSRMDDERNLSIIKSLIYMARLLDLNVIAEGVETPRELETLKKLGIQMGQGFLFAKGLPLDQFQNLPLKFGSAKAA